VLVGRSLHLCIVDVGDEVGCCCGCGCRFALVGSGRAIPRAIVYLW